MSRTSKLWACVLTGVVAALPTLAFGGERLPQGLSVAKSEDGLVLSTSAGQPLYRLDIDRMARRRGGGGVLAARCADVCDRLWRPALAPKTFKADGDWSVTERKGGAQLTYKGDPLYSFAGKSLDEAAKIQVAPPYFSSYAAKPTLLVDGVPVATLYWRPALYQPAAPKVVTPAGVTAHWSKVAYVFADADNQPLYTAPKTCARACDGLTPFPAPLAALPVGEWRPVQGTSGERLWSYRGRVVYQAAEGQAAPAPSWRPIEVP
ncbi:hypothetical protein LJR225_001369 [Phenylobacterium sp. LjRoot225]|uniref:hypothetical protein n=1 Tax=Phenylobacterium sp. LjRoot225 TaxID=3342285 RepID=UPI003ECCC24A